LNITLLNTTITTVPTAKGSYQQMEVAYKNNTFQGKVEGKKIMSFGAGKTAFDVLSVAQPGESFEVTTNKNDKGYIDWVSLQKAGAGVQSVPASNVQPGSTKTVAAASRGSFETPEERAQRQVLIVRQSSLSNAVATLAVGAKTALKKEDVIALATDYENYVMGKGLSGFDDFPDVPDDFEKPNVV
jgi:hypothetical protein